MGPGRGNISLTPEMLQAAIDIIEKRFCDKKPIKEIFKKSIFLIPPGLSENDIEDLKSKIRGEQNAKTNE